ncbi:hypothetical protein HN695_00095 [Candidatus Woesearchaeota archaeon]|jgi:hypothetical protein|nr:hypothetical protein [Candidatus Woesearchaeota archaeon]MBT5272864.1 hypothetical protein [Candidatus Woesearchaeota archaeon]MBT6041330.1 hypothetical protein [Candidatus Woesearchaeota archaeon]MBT6336410.1 hypothetical protein [Candidatus Woesearchaeota archaeon]MBT7926713.1 hypothetical protein [Candidatus Woesearchaeota archaeon]
MTIDTKLTFEAARESIGQLVSLSEESLMSLDFTRRKSQEYDRMFGIEYSKDHYDVLWRFNKDSEIIQALKGYREIQKESGMNSRETTIASSRLLMAVGMIGLSELLIDHEEEIGADLNHNEGDYNPRAFPVWDVLYNAMEHASKYGKNGDVHMHFYGGSNGILVTVEDHGDLEKLKRLSVKEAERIYHENNALPSVGKARTYADIRRRLNPLSNAPLVRGLGMCMLTVDPNVIIGSDRHEDKFRVMAMYLKT